MSSEATDSHLSILHLLSSRRSDRFSYWANLAVFALVSLVFLIAPLFAFQWRARPFPGFLVEQTLVVSEANGRGWNGRQAGLNYPQRVQSIDELPVSTLQEFRSALRGRQPGDILRVETILPDGSARLYPSVRLQPFPLPDFLRLFALPYLIGLVYLVIGAWVFLVRGETRPGRAFAFFCFSAALVNALTFDLATSKAGSWLWTWGVAQLGGGMVLLALLFPVEWPALQRRPWLSYLPLGLSLALAAWGWMVLYDPARPWDYIVAWRFSYIYLGAGILVLVGRMVYQQWKNPHPLARQQSRVILLGVLVAFAPIAVWALAPLLGFPIAWNPAVFTPLLLVFPLSIGMAIARYRLWDLDFFINRTLVYGALTLTLGLLFTASVLLIQILLRALVGGPAPLGLAVSTLAVVALFNPLRRSLQSFIDQRFYRTKYNAAQNLSAFSASLRDEVDLNRLTGRLEDIVWDTIQPAHVFTWLRSPRGYWVPLHADSVPPRVRSGVEVPLNDPLIPYLRDASGPVQLDRLELDSPALERLVAGRVRLAVPLVCSGELTGWLSLGPRLSEREYSLDDRELLAGLASQAAPAVHVAQLVRQQQIETQERERLEHELRLARSIQQSLLPKELPDLPGWDMAVYYQPAREVGGDFYDFVRFPDGRMGLFTGDVAGKGIPAAMLMASTRSILRAVAAPDVSPGEALRQANNTLVGDIPPAMFVTCLYVILDPASGEMRFANAGHNLPCLNNGGRVSELRATGMPLGLLPDRLYEEKSASIHPGENLVFYSDGLTEAHNPHREMFGGGRLQRLIAQPGQDGQGLIDRLLAELRGFTTPGWEQEDDITIVTLRRTG